MNRIEAAINAALDEINMSPKLFGKCDENTARSIIERTKKTFVEGTPSVWWFSLKHKVTIQHFADGGFRHLLESIPQPDERCWFIPEIHEQYPLVYDAQIPCIIDILGNCFGFDYYLVGNYFDWLIAETDADQLIVSILPPSDD